MFSAVVRDGVASTIDLDPSVRAFKTNLVIPVPSLASKVSGALGFISDAFSIDNGVSLVAGSAGSSGIVRGAVVRDGNASSINLDPSGRAFKADSVVPVPGLAAEVFGLFNGVDHASITFDVVSLVASSAGS